MLLPSRRHFRHPELLFRQPLHNRRDFCPERRRRVRRLLAPCRPPSFRAGNSQVLIFSVQEIPVSLGFAPLTEAGLSVAAVER